MRAYLLTSLIIAALSLSACSTSSQSTATPAPSKIIASVNGVQKATLSDPVVIHANSEMQGVPMEYEWIRKNYPNSKPKGQALIEQNGKVYDQIDIVTASGEVKSLFFDITSFYGKL